MFHQFNYESGEGLLKEFDSFTLESFNSKLALEPIYLNSES